MPASNNFPVSGTIRTSSDDDVADVDDDGDADVHVDVGDDVCV